VSVSLMAVSSEEQRARCPSCSATIAADQRYCLVCGQPVAPASFSFLDVLQPEAPSQASGQASVAPLPAGYVSVIEPPAGVYSPLRRYSGLFGLLTVLLMSVTVGLLVGHWITQKGTPGQQVIKVEGLAGTPLAAAPGSGTTTGASTTPAPQARGASKEEAKTEAAEAKEAKAVEKAPPPKPVKVSATKLQKLGNTTGKKHEEEVSKLGDKPIETGG
jgi:hypothetical protein